MADAQPPLAVHADIQRVIFSSTALQQRCTELGRQLAVDYATAQPLVLVTLSGALIFASDLVRCIQPLPGGLQVDFVRAASYGSGTVSNGQVALQDCGKIPCSGRNVVIVEDIVDSGHTVRALVRRCRELGASSVEVVALLNKVVRREVDVAVKYQGFECPDEFVVGYGLDYNELYRTLPFVGMLKPEVYASN